MAGVTINGFVPKRFPEIIIGLRESAKPIFQDLVKPGEEVDVGDTSTIGRLIGLIAPDLDELWQAAQEVYQAFDPNSASGVALDNVVQYMGVTRRQGAPTVVRASVWGENGVTLPVGQAIRNGTGDLFESVSELQFNMSDIIGFGIVPSTIVSGQTCEFTLIIEEGIFTIRHLVEEGQTVDDVLEGWKTEFDNIALTRFTSRVDGGKLYIEVNDYFSYIVLTSLVNSAAVEFKKRLTFNSSVEGEIPAPVNTLTQIVTPIYGWISVNNELTAELGSTHEDDEALRQRFRVSKAVRASNMAESLYSQLIELEDVQYVRIYENMTNEVDILGIPAHSFMALVEGGVSTNIGEIIWNNKPLGIASFGQESVVVRDSQNIERTVYFSRPVRVPVYVKVVISKVSTDLPEDAIDRIREEVVNYINTGIPMGSNVVYTRMFSPINKVEGHQIDTLEIGRTSADLESANMIMEWNERVFTLPEYVDVSLIS